MAILLLGSLVLMLNRDCTTRMIAILRGVQTIIDWALNVIWSYDVLSSTTTPSVGLKFSLNFQIGIGFERLPSRHKRLNRGNDSCFENVSISHNGFNRDFVCLVRGRRKTGQLKKGVQIYYASIHLYIS